jgi:7-carboxy-7-deazaguanine synthase
MIINEIFYSIQGESSYTGWPCAFIRLSGCDLRCSYCDTQYAFNEGHEMSVPGVLRAIAPFPTRLVLVTGGEPMLQPAVHDLFRGLLEGGYTVCMETGGHITLIDVDPRVHKIMDLKCPSSGMAPRNHYENLKYLTRNDEVKFVVGGREDFDWACERIREFDLTSRVGTVLISPVHRRIAYDQLARWILDSGLQVRLQLQLHKIIWPGTVRGV